MIQIENVLFPTDGSKESKAALAFAVQVARSFDAVLHLLQVDVLHDAGGEAEEPDYEELSRALKDHTGPILEKLAAERKNGNVEIQRAHRRGVAAAPEILAYADEVGADIIVMATHGRRGIRRWMLGSVTDEVLRAAQIPVLTLRSDSPSPDSGRILVPIDFGERTGESMHYAERLSAWTGADVELLHVIEVPLVPTVAAALPEIPQVTVAEVETEVKKKLQGVAEQSGLDPDRVHITVLEGTSPAKRIADRVELGGIGLIVIPSHGHGMVERLILGSVVDRVVRTVSAPVLVLGAPPKKTKRGADDSEEATEQSGAA